MGIGTHAAAIDIAAYGYALIISSSVCYCTNIDISRAIYVSILTAAIYVAGYISTLNIPGLIGINRCQCDLRQCTNVYGCITKYMGLLTTAKNIAYCTQMMRIIICGIISIPVNFICMETGNHVYVNNRVTIDIGTCTISTAKHVIYACRRDYVNNRILFFGLNQCLNLITR